MSLSRDMIQGFIDGYVMSGGDPAAISTAVATYAVNNPTYSASADEVAAIVSDLNSYRVTPVVP